mmetsp:Transcript_63039/g.168374  ORF Transcript_63039/g.168374 Transcript_63039/m.168374 type:complete len:242 (+) Transcript_63039:72-797(+)
MSSHGGTATLSASGQQAVLPLRSRPVADEPHYGHGGQTQDDVEATQDCEQGSEEIVPPLLLILDLHGERLDVVVESRLGDLALFQPRGATEVQELVGVTGLRLCSDNLQVVLPSLVEAVGAELPVVHGHLKLPCLRRHPFPEAAKATNRIREGQVVHTVRDIGHGSHEVLVTAAGEELQVPRRLRHPQVAARVAARLSLLVVLTPRCLLRVGLPVLQQEHLRPVLDGDLSPVSVEAGEGSI